MNLNEAMSILQEARRDLDGAVGSLTEADRLQEQSRNLVNASHVSLGEARDRVRAVFQAGIEPGELNQALGMIETTMNAAHEIYGLAEGVSTAVRAVQTQCQAVDAKIVEVSGS